MILVVFPMKIGRAEIGIIVLANNLPYIGWLNYFLSFFLPFVNLMMGYSFSCAITGAGLVLFMSDRKDFLCRMKGNKFVAALLAICGLILIVWSLFFVYAGFATLNLGNAPRALHPPTFEEWTTFLLFCAWIGLMLTSGILWIFYGLKMWRYDESQPLKQENRQ